MRRQGFNTTAVFVAFVSVLSCLPVSADETTATAEQLAFFEREVRPLLVEHCYSCHSVKAKKLQAGLLMDSRAALLKGGESGEAIVPGDADASLLIEAVRYESYEMPPKGRLSEKHIETLERWVEMGAPWPQEEAPTAEAARPEFNLQQRRSEHWVWQPVQSAAIPEVTDTKWPRDNLDYFVLAELEGAKMHPAEDADRTALLRRLYFDLTGLPPTPEQAAAFLDNTSPDATEQLVDELLESPHFGERWGRHWLDLVRYAESRGHEFDNDTPNAFQYRDYIIRALNADVPYDQLVREHLAGDLLAEPRLHPEEGFNESILGTGFWFLGEWVHSPVDIRKDEADRFDNMIDVMSKTFLGVTVACARCHDHKFDAISTADYYSLSGFLQSSDYRQVRFESIEQNRRVARQLAQVDAKYQRQISDLLDAQGVHVPRQMSYLARDAIVVDYSNIPQTQFIQDGFIFGSAPQRAGLAYVDFQDPSAVRIAEYGAAVSDSFWNGLESVTEGQVQNRSAIAQLPKSGRTLRSPTFELKDATVSCLVQGAGHVIACVDSHRLIAGPLHKETIKPVSAGDESWVTLNLGRYIGHRLHLEFVPAKDSRLSVRMVVQGLDAAGRAEIDRQLAATNQQFHEYAQTAEAILNSRVEVEEDVFADFESGTYDGWTVTGEAFGDMPQTLETIADYQGRINGRGRYFVNSHNIRPGGDVRRGDSLTGTLTSRPFIIDFDAIEFLVGGGPHQGRTCVNLVIDGRPVLSATGRSNNQMSLNTWDVREFAGREARIQVVDDHQSGWGNIGIDHIVFQRRSGAADGNITAQKILEAWQRERAQLGRMVVRRSRLALAMMDGTGEDDHVLIRGNSSRPGEIEPRHFLTAISGDQPMQIRVGSGRLELAEQINDPENPLTSRVIVNRIWHYLIGRGIVPTTDDFGVLGLRPTHPQLLDHLATRFVQDGRSIKRMIRTIVLSRTYQMSSHADPSAVASDPKNLLWHHRPPKRLEGEVIRDALLSLSGRLDETLYGAPIPIHLTAFMDGRGRPGKSGPLDGAGRRSIYTAVRRNFLSPFMLTFDSPTPFSTMGRRNVSNVPAQALILMNDPLVIELAGGWAERAIQKHSDIESRIGWMYQTAFARQPTLQEQAVATAYVTTQAAERGVDDSDPQLWADVAHALINMKEFIFLR
ncbi:MAG: PSD1 and planctomycete cytochrome C domain-containing protein [Fuerstiella sp.]